MLALDNQTLGDNLLPVDWNQLPTEIQNAIEDSAQTLDGDSVRQLGQAIADYMVRSTFYTGGGTAADQTLTSLTTMEGAVYQDGMRVFWRPSNASVNGGTTIAVNGQAAKTLLQEDGTAVIANDLLATKDGEARYDGTNFLLIGA